MVVLTILFRVKWFSNLVLLEVKLPYDSVGWSGVGWSVCQNFLECQEVTHPCSHLSTCWLFKWTNWSPCCNVYFSDVFTMAGWEHFASFLIDFLSFLGVHLDQLVWRTKSTLSVRPRVYHLTFVPLSFFKGTHSIFLMGQTDEKFLVEFLFSFFLIAFLVEFLFSCFLDRFLSRVLVFLFSYFVVFFYKFPHLWLSHWVSE